MQNLNLGVYTKFSKDPIKDENTSKIQEFLKSKRKSHQQNDDNYVDLG